MSTLRRDDLDTVTRLMLFPRDLLMRGSVTILELRMAYCMAPTREDRKAILNFACVYSPNVHGAIGELLEAFDMEEADDEWRELVSTLVARSMNRTTVYDLRSCFGDTGRTREAKELIIGMCCRLMQTYSDLSWLYHALDTDDERRADVYARLEAAAFASYSDALHFLEHVALPASGNKKPQVLRDAWDRMWPLVRDTQRALDLLKGFYVFTAPVDVLAAILERAVELAITPVDNARLWVLDVLSSNEAFRAALLHDLMEGHPSWTVEEWLDVLSVDEHLCTLLELMMEEHFYPKLAQCRDARGACYRAKSAPVRERAFTCAIETAQTVEDWQGIIAAVANGVVESRGCEMSYHARMCEATWGVDDWLSILRFPMNSELDRIAAVGALRSLLTS